MGIDSINGDGETPAYETAVAAVFALTPKSSKSDVDAVIKELVRTIVNTKTLPAQRSDIIRSIGNKANIFESSSKMRRNKQAMYIANEIRSTVTSVKNFFNAPMNTDRSKYLKKYGL